MESDSKCVESLNLIRVTWWWLVTVFIDAPPPLPFSMSEPDQVSEEAKWRFHKRDTANGMKMKNMTLQGKISFKNRIHLVSISL